MKRLALLLLLAAAPARAAIESHEDLTTGTYAVTVSGMLCTACSRAIRAELASLDAVEKARVDWETGQLVLTIKTGKYLRFSQLRKALKRATSKVNLGNKLEVQTLRYRP